MDNRNSEINMENLPNSFFKKGMKLQLRSDKNYVKRIQTSSGGWLEIMSKYLNQIVTVDFIDLDNLLQVVTADHKTFRFSKKAFQLLPDQELPEDKQFVFRTPTINNEPSSSYLHSFPVNAPVNNQDTKPLLSSFRTSKKKETPSVTTKKHPKFEVGDEVRLNPDEQLVADKQKKAGGYSVKIMRSLLGTVLTVVECDPDKYVKVIGKSGHHLDLHQDLLTSVHLENSKCIHSMKYPTSGSDKLTGNSLKANIIKIPKPEESNRKNSIISDCLNKTVEPIFEAVINNDIDKLHTHMNEIMLNSKNEEGCTPVNLACLLGHKEIVEEILSFFSADLNVVDCKGHCAWHNTILSLNYNVLDREKPKRHENVVEILQSLVTYQRPFTKVIHEMVEICKQMTEIPLLLIAVRSLFAEQLRQHITNPVTYETEREMNFSNQPTSNPISLLQRKREEEYNDKFEDSTNLSIFSLREPPVDDSTIQSLCLNRSYETLDIPSQKTISSNPFQGKLKRSVVSEAECKICCFRRINVSLNCGHTMCQQCSEQMFICAYCKEDILERKIIYI